MVTPPDLVYKQILGYDVWVVPQEQAENFELNEGERELLLPKVALK